MPQYIKVDKQKKLFEGCKVGDIITFNPKKAYPDNDAEIASLLKVKKEDVKDLKSDFTFQITEISRFVKADVDRAIDMKLTEALKKVVKLTNKKVSLDGFNKLFEEK